MLKLYALIFLSIGKLTIYLYVYLQYRSYAIKFSYTQFFVTVIAIPVSSWSFSYYIPALGIYWNSWRTLLVIFSVPSLLSAVGLFFLQESPKFTFALGDEERTLDILKKMHKVNMGKKAEDFEVICSF